MSDSKTVTIQLQTKDPDAWGYVIGSLRLPKGVYGKYIEFCEYATVELKLNSDLKVVSARLVPL